MPFRRLPLNGDMPLLPLKAQGTTLLLSSINHNKMSLVQSSELTASLPKMRGAQSSRLPYFVDNESKHLGRPRYDTSHLSSLNLSLRILESQVLLTGHPCRLEAVPLPAMKFKSQTNKVLRVLHELNKL